MRNRAIGGSGVREFLGYFEAFGLLAPLVLHGRRAGRMTELHRAQVAVVMARKAAGEARDRADVFLAGEALA